MAFTTTDFPGLLIYEPAVYKDDRGFFFESYNDKVYQQYNLHFSFIQDNQSHSYYGVVRGLHYQLNPHAQTKLVRVLHGKVVDTVVDIRKGSPKFGQSFSIELSAENQKQLLVPKGFAHGFSVLSETADVLYKCDSFYHKDSEAGIIYNDPALYIDWRVPSEKIVISGKDLELPSFNNCINNFEF